MSGYDKAPHGESLLDRVQGPRGSSTPPACSYFTPLASFNFFQHIKLLKNFLILYLYNIYHILLYLRYIYSRLRYVKYLVYYIFYKSLFKSCFGNLNDFQQNRQEVRRRFVSLVNQDLSVMLLRRV